MSKSSQGRSALITELASARLTTSDDDEAFSPFELYAELPSGQRLVPGVSRACPGPDGGGGCPLAERPCAGATWIDRRGRVGWQFVFRPDSPLCPRVALAG